MGRLHPQGAPGGCVPRSIPGCRSGVRCRTARALLSSHPKKVSWLGDESKLCSECLLAGKAPGWWWLGESQRLLLGPWASTVGVGRFTGEQNENSCSPVGRCRSELGLDQSNPPRCLFLRRLAVLGGLQLLLPPALQPQTSARGALWSDTASRSIPA